MSEGPRIIREKLEDLVVRERSRSRDVEKLTVKDKGMITTYESTLEMYARGFKVERINLKRSLSKE
jgi:DNA polymerase III alpha subunit (gram-positive type)